MLGPTLKRHTVADLIARFDAADVPCAPVNDIEGAFRHPHTAARKMTVDVTHPVYGTLQTTSLPLGSLMRSEHQAPPLHGEHTVAVLRELGYESAAIEELLRGRNAMQCDAQSAGERPVASGSMSPIPTS
jgi:crotonobetainyl-CoA:carnitine CoA-transferase CaiB-like acyl-CoA transferase